MASEQTYQCPNCGYEYEPWVQMCPDCGTHLESYPRSEAIKGKLDTDTDPKWTIVTNVPNAIIGNFIKSQIEDAGIPVLMFRSRSADIAEFSHNDFVPQDLLVPMDRVREARELVDSAPGNLYGPSEVNYDEPQPGNTTIVSGVPEGWRMLPTEADLRARQLVRRTHGDALKGWYWSDDTTHARSEPSRGNDWLDDYDPYDDSPGYASDYRRTSGRGINDEWGKPSRWVRVVYGVLLLAMSLPFLMQLMQHMWSILGIRK